MLVLTRKLDESIVIGKDIEVKVVQIRGANDQAVVRLGITAPRHVTVLRKEILLEVAEENRKAATPPAGAQLQRLPRPNK